MFETFLEMLKCDDFLGRGDFFFLFVTFCHLISVSDDEVMDKSISSWSCVSDMCVMDAGERVGLVVLDKLDVYSLYASMISSNNSPDESSESGVDVATGFWISGGRGGIDIQSEGRRDKESFT